MPAKNGKAKSKKNGNGKPKKNGKKKAKTKAVIVRGVGRPTKYKEEFARQAGILCRMGSTDKQLAEFFEVDEATINRWKINFPEFCESIKNGKPSADERIVASLFQRAEGYQHPEDKIFCNKDGVVTVVPTIKHYPPDTAACVIWLCNRMKAKWQNTNRIEHTGKDGAPIEMKNQWDKIIDAIQAAVSDPEERKAIYDKLASKL